MAMYCLPGVIHVLYARLKRLILVVVVLMLIAATYKLTRRNLQTSDSTHYGSRVITANGAAEHVTPLTSTSSITLALPLSSAHRHETLGYLQTSSRNLAATTTSSYKPAVMSTQKASLPDVIKIMILSYQRTGSSFLGKLFQTEDVFYIFEPLDPVYTSMYGTDMGWNVPTDIWFLPNGTMRVIPTEELAVIDLVLESVYNCKMSELPTAMLIHQLWTQFSHQMKTLPYVHCLLRKFIHRNTLDKCRSYIYSRCGGRFRDDGYSLSQCQRALYNSGKWYANYDDLWQMFQNETDVSNFKLYFLCLRNYEQKAKSCAMEYLDKPCLNYRVRTVKTVRASVITATRLLNKVSSLKVIHSFRDPRGTTRSRTLQSWSRGIYEGENLSNISRTYCASVLRDYKVWLKLNSSHPGQLINLLYDDLILKSQSLVMNLESFTKVTLNKQILESVTNFSIARNTTSIDVDNWNRLARDHQSVDGRIEQHVLLNAKWVRLSTPTTVSAYSDANTRGIDTECREFFSQLPFDWSHIVVPDHPVAMKLYE